MDYEKKYKEALGWMRDLYPSLHGMVKEDAEYYFPELKESEDEQIRKVLVGWFKRYKEQDTCGSEMFNGIPTDNILTWLEKQVEQKSAWSEEDALRLEEAIYMIKARGWIRGDDAVKLVLDWLKSLKDRVSPQPKQEWSEVDEYTLNETIQHLKELIKIDKIKHCACDVQFYQRDIDWLKSLKQRIGG